MMRTASPNMELQSCPRSGASSRSGHCPAGSNHRTGVAPRGCAFSGFQIQTEQAPLYGIPEGPYVQQHIERRDHKTMVDMLLPPVQDSHLRSVKTPDSLCPTPDDVLAAALGAPARRVLLRAEALGPRTGYRDGHLTSRWGFCPPSPSESPMALAAGPGRVWSDLCDRLPGLVGRGKIRNAIAQLPLVQGTADTIPDQALWAAASCLGILSSVYRYEERNSGGSAPLVMGAVPTEEQLEELKGIPTNIAIPYRTICVRLGRPLPHLTQADLSMTNFKFRDPTSIFPYPHRLENMDLRWPVFNDRAEATFLLCMTEVHGLFIPGVEIIARCQELVMERDNEGLLRELIKLKEICDQFGYVFHKISTNPRSGEQFANPVDWGQKFAKFSAPLSRRVPALSGLALPIFHVMDAFLGRKKYDTFLGKEALHLRTWLPLNVRAFITAIEKYYSVPEYIASSGDARLMGVFDGIVESYAGERGFMGTHRYKVYGFLELVTKTGRSETNGGSGAGDTESRPWEEVHRMLSDAMIERLEPFRKSGITLKPQEMRGCFEECRFEAKIGGRSHIDADSERSTAMVTINLAESGITFGPGDRLAIMPLNKWKDVLKVADALGIVHRLDEDISLEKGQNWQQYAKHEESVRRFPTGRGLKVMDVLRKGHLAPLTRETVTAVHILLQASSPKVHDILSSEHWPVSGSLGDLLLAARSDVSPDSPIWETAFNIDDLSWLLKLVAVEVPRTYSISSYCPWDELPDSLELTVSRAEHPIHPSLVLADQSPTRQGVSSGFLNPHPTEEESERVLAEAVLRDNVEESELVLVGISRPLNFQLPISPTAPVAMFAGGSGIAPFHGFLKSRFDSSKGVSGRNVLFLGVQSRKKFLYERELRDFVKYDGLELHTAFSRDTKGLVCEGRNLIEKEMENRYLDAAIIEQGGTVADIVMPTKLGGLGGYLYVCGSMAVYETVIKGIKKAIYNNRMATQDSAEAILAIAFAERRFMLDIFMTPKAMSFKEPTIPMSTLARNTGHRAGEASREFTRTWIGVHGAVYDVTDFLPIHPGGSLIVSASAGLDASRTFDDLAHTSNPEVMSLLSKYFIGYLAPKHDFRTSPELRALYVGWSDYLRTSVENLTTLSLEVKSLKTDATTTWFSGGLLNMTGVNKFHQFQIRLLKNGFPSLFGPKLQELYLKLSFALVSSRNAHSLVLPDVMGIVARAQSSVHSAAVLQELSQIGDLACDPSTAQSFERGIIHYAQAVTELDVKLLEQVREEICTGMDAFDLVASTAKGYSGSSHVAEKQKLNKVAAFLVSLLEKIAERLDTFYVELSALSLYRPEIEGNPARARWRLVKRRIADGSFFLYTQELSLETALEPDSTGGGRLGSLRRRSVWGGTGRGVTFDQVVAHASSMVKTSIESAQSGSSKSAGEQQHFTDGRFPGTLADAHSMRAESANGKGTTSYESMLERKATLRTKRFLAQNSNFLEGFGRQPGSNNAGVSSQEQPQYIDDSSANQQQLAPDKHRLFDRDMMQLQQQQQQQQQQAIGTSPLEYQRSEVFSPRGRANTIEIQRPPLQDKSFAYSSSTSQDNGPKNLAPQTTFYNIASANSSGVRLSESPRIRSGTFNGSVAGRQSPRLSNHGMAYTPEREAQPQSHHNYGIPSVEQQQQHRIDSPSQSAYHPRPSSSYSTPSEQEAQPRPNSGSFGTNNMKSENVFDRYEREPAPPRTRSGFLERSLDILTAGSSARNISKDRSATQLPSTTGSPRNFPSPSLGSVFGAMLVGTSAASIGGMDSRSVTSGGGYPNGQGRASPPGSLFSGPEGQSFSPPRGNYQTQGSPNPNYYQQAQPIPHPSPQPQYHFQKVPNMTDRTRPRGASANYSAFNPRGVGGPGGSPQNVGNWGPGNTHPPTMVPNSMPSGGGPPAMHSSEADLLSKGLEALQRRRVS